jgi:RNA polymerase sigma factor (sigma-70 family)
MRAIGRIGEPVAPWNFSGPRLYRVAYSILSDDTDAEDVTQGVLLQVVRKLDSFPGEADFTTWLHRITVNATLCRCRKHRHQHECQAIAPLEVLLNGEKYTCTCRLATPGENADLNSGRKSLQPSRHGDRIILDIADETQGLVDFGEPASCTYCG